MSALKSVIITLPKGLSKVPGVPTVGELPRQVSKINFAASVLAEKTKMEKKLPKQEDVAHDDGSLFKPDVCLRGKKRRLDHLTWEEKLQRKKLKNRVAAQTSRDRKKAKLDELEETVRILREKNELLTQECSMLRTQNESLSMDAKRLRRERDSRNSGETYCSLCQVRVGCVVPSLGSAVSPDNPLPQGGTTQSAPSLTLTPGATILLKILTLYLLSKNCLATSKEMIASNDSRNLQKAFCERLPQKWKQILIDQMNNCSLINNVCPTYFVQMSIKENTPKEPDDPKGMVGQAPKNVEANTASRSLNGYRQPWHSVPSTVTTPCVVTAATTPVSIKSEVEVKQEEPDAGDLDTVYGTYDETTNCITIIYPGEENNMGIQECVQEVSSDSGVGQGETQSSYLTANHCYTSQFSPAYTCMDSMSPSSIHSEDAENGYQANKLDMQLSDGGYESHDSPIAEVQSTGHCRNTSTNASNVPLTDLWHESFTELFPTLA